MAQTREYKVVEAGSSYSLEKELNNASKDGYEVVTAFTIGNWIVGAILARPVEITTPSVSLPVE